MSKESGRGTGWHHKVRGESKPEVEEHVQNPAAYAGSGYQETILTPENFKVEELGQPKPPEEEAVVEEKPKPRPRGSSKRPGSKVSPDESDRLEA